MASHFSVIWMTSWLPRERSEVRFPERAKTIFHCSSGSPSAKWAKTYVATDIRDDILRPADPESSSGSFLRSFKMAQGVKMADSVVDIIYAAPKGVGGTVASESALRSAGTLLALWPESLRSPCCGLAIQKTNPCSILKRFCLCYTQENTFKCEAFDYWFNVGKCRLSSVHPEQAAADSGGNSSLVLSKDTNVYTKLYTSDYTKYDAVVYAATPDKTISDTVSADTCAKACTEATEFRCEAFEVCTSAKSCNLHKTHVFSSAASTGTAAPSTQTPDCVHYSRDHLYDYIRRDHKRITGHDEVQADVTEVSKCAYLCASGEMLPGCASFEVTQIQQGNTRCVFSTADPTNNNSSSSQISIEDSLAWALYTRANVLPIVNPAAHSGASTGNHASSTPRPDTNTCAEKSKGGDSDTNVRVGIAFGTLVLGVLLGVVVTHFGAKLYRQKYHKTEDLHGLSTWKH
ncbi:antigen b membrane protein [Plakobranchus ocellatus]|uniref:Antigen b membrane protein n=1 Tax=Plakobranchus ocellatus TaxID=259542 RepID=A0AAV4AAL1_9GAST|nr:antigen b membrane protein [Plakobranchus ocellatus]